MRRPRLPFYTTLSETSEEGDVEAGLPEADDEDALQ
jgi:hypothetical protein